MHFKITQEMKQRIIVYSASLIIAILFFTILNRFKDITRSIQFIITILFPFLLGIGLAFILNNPQKWVENKLLANAPMQNKHKKNFIDRYCVYSNYWISNLVFLYYHPEYD